MSFVKLEHGIFYQCSLNELIQHQKIEFGPSSIKMSLPSSLILSSDRLGASRIARKRHLVSTSLVTRLSESQRKDHGGTVGFVDILSYLVSSNANVFDCSNFESEHWRTWVRFRLHSKWIIMTIISSMNSKQTWLIP